MSVERIESLHQEASEHYLNGRFAEAIRAWNQVLSLDPANEQALEGVRMSSLLGEGEDAAGQPPSPEPSLDDDIDAGLRVFEFDAKAPDAPAPAGDAPVGDLPDPNRQSDGIDFGDLQQVEAIPLAAGVAEENLDLGPDAEETGLAPLAPHLPGSDPAVVELARRVHALLDDAKAKAAAGATAEALAVLARVQVLDEDNAEAAELADRLRNDSDRAAGEIDRWMTEGVQAFEAGSSDEARGWFLKVIGRMPGHAEAKHYLTELGRASASDPGAEPALEGSGDLLSSFLSNSEPPAVDFPSFAGRAADAAGEGIPLAPHPEPESPSAPSPMRHRERPAPPAAARTGGSRKGLVVALGAVAVCAVLGVAWYVLSPGGGSAPAGEPAAVPRAPVRHGQASAPPPPAETEGSPAIPPLGASMARGRAAMDRRDYDGAILAFHDALRADPANSDAHAAMAQATEAYKVEKARREQIQGVRDAFRDGEYSSALRVIYRLPDEFDAATVNRWKVNGWFNLAVVALRAGEVPQAIQHLDEALAIQDDADARKWKAFAQRYVNLPKDRVYYSAAESIGFRSRDD
jgi:tetratricopeptide (TPR) repeat protein